MSDISEHNELITESVANDNNESESLGHYMNDWLVRIKQGDLGSLPIIIGLVVIALIFGSQSQVFFSAQNFVNLMLQVAGLTTIAIGVVFVLLVAEIDLSVAFVSGLSGVIMTLMLRDPEPALPWPIAIGAALVFAALIGLIQGTIITRAGVPSFIVTLAGLLIWSGAILILTTQYSTAGTVVIQDKVVLGVANSFLPALWGWVLYGASMLVYALSVWNQRRELKQRNLPRKPMAIDLIQVLLLGLIAGGAVYYANTDRGVPTVAVIVLVLLLFWTFIASRTRFGRYIYAVGGNPEAARRAGISVPNIKTWAFVIGSFMAGAGGIILASRLRSVSTNDGGGNLLMSAIAAAVIGGTSLFGGSGFVMSALLGALVIQSVENGMGLLGLPSGIKFVVNGLVLLGAVLIDALTKRRRESSGIV